MENGLCEEYVYSEDYVEYILESGGNVNRIQEIFQPDCTQSVNENFVIIYENRESKGDLSYEKHGYGAVPKCFGLLDVSALESMGVFQVRRQPNLDLYGNEVLIGFVDTGIDYTNVLFQNADGTSKIEYIWDQSISGETENQSVPYGMEYTKIDIDQALARENPREALPHADENYHGTFMAALAAGNIQEESEFSGIAPNAKILMVKLKEAKKNIKDFYGIGDNIPCYQENDIMMGIEYLLRKSVQMQRPMVICIGVGTNGGNHEGLFPLGVYLNRMANFAGVCIVAAAGNETNLGHHYENEIQGEEEIELELEIEEEMGISFELWTGFSGYLTVGIQSPSGEYTERIPRRSYEQKLDFLFEDTTIYVFYERVEYYSGEQVIVVRMKNLAKGIWKIRVYNEDVEAANFHIWLPMREFISQTTKFLAPSPDTIICEPGNVNRILTVGAYNHLDNTIYINSSRGYTSGNSIKPDFVAPGVNVYGPVSALRFGERSGTSVAVANAAGIAAMLLQWGDGVIIRLS